MTDADHVKAFRLFELASAGTVGKDFQLQIWEKEHVQLCAECRGVLDVFENQLKRQLPLPAGVPVRRFNVGDHVEIIGPGAHNKKRGLVTEVREPQTGDFVYRYRVYFATGGADTFFGFELESAA